MKMYKVTLLLFLVLFAGCATINDSGYRIRTIEGRDRWGHVQWRVLSDGEAAFTIFELNNVKHLGPVEYNGRNFAIFVDLRRHTININDIMPESIARREFDVIVRERTGFNSLAELNQYRERQRQEEAQRRRQEEARQRAERAEREAEAQRALMGRTRRPPPGVPLMSQSWPILDIRTRPLWIRLGRDSIHVTYKINGFNHPVHNDWNLVRLGLLESSFDVLNDTEYRLLWELYRRVYNRLGEGRYFMVFVEKVGFISVSQYASPQAFIFFSGKTGTLGNFFAEEVWTRRR
jgi:hypothetical protein